MLKKCILLFFALNVSVVSYAEGIKWENQEGIITFSDKPKFNKPKHPTKVRVKTVYDGDTFKSTDGLTFRLLGIDTPETEKRGDGGDYYGQEAKLRLKELLLKKQVLLKYDKNVRDDYGRYLAYVFLKDGSFVNRLLVKEGYARVFMIPPNLKNAADFRKLEERAIQDNVGLWGVPETFAVISPEDSWKYHKRVKFVRGEVTTIKRKKKRVELVFNNGAFKAYIYRKNLRYFPRIESYLHKTLVVKGKIKKKVNHTTTVLFHPVQLY